jgi:hypothetical protein
MNKIFSFHETRVCIFLKTSPGPYKDMWFDFHSKKVLKVMQFTAECPVVLYPDNCMSHRTVCERVGKPEVWWANRPMWAVASCSPIEKDGSFKDAYCLLYKDNYGCSKHLWSVGQFPPNYTAPYPRRQPSSYSPSWEPEISWVEKLI